MNHQNLLYSENSKIIYRSRPDHVSISVKGQLIVFCMVVRPIIKELQWETEKEVLPQTLDLVDLFLTGGAIEQLYAASKCNGH
jgi:hypothetical protein